MIAFIKRGPCEHRTKLKVGRVIEGRERMEARAPCSAPAPV